MSGSSFQIRYLHEELSQYSGVDVWEVRLTDPGDAAWETERGPGPWEHWELNWMGLQDSPYRSLQWQVCLKFEVYGDRKDTANLFHWDRVEFNLPGSRRLQVGPSLGHEVQEGRPPSRQDFCVRG